MHRGVMFQFFEWNSTNDGSHWREVAQRAREISALGATAVWLPPAYKGMDGANDTGYAVYDLFDLGEFDQKNSVRTKYGTKDEYLAAIQAVRDAGMDVYADVVLNHRMGADEIEEVEVVEIDRLDRTREQTAPYTIKAYCRFTFPGRGGTYSNFQWRAEHFTSYDFNADAADEAGKIYRRSDVHFSGEVDAEFGNFDYLMGADVNTYHPEVRQELFAWTRWYVETTNINGFRLDAIKHIPHSFYREWFEHVRHSFPGREFFAVGEYWSPNVADLLGYLEHTEGHVRLFDVPLHMRFVEAGQKGRDYDLSKIFDGSLVQANALMSVTFVDNHDSQPGQSLESWVADWFKPLAYALILLRQDGYPCVFYGDYYGNPGRPDPSCRLVSHKTLIDTFLYARGRYTYGEQCDYFDHPTCVAWTWSGNEQHPGSMAVVMSTAGPGVKRLHMPGGGRTYTDLTNHIAEKIVTDAEGFADFHCPAGSLSAWCMD
ncbi:MAG TPA: alpha-amylase [Tepidisphaeraceae bacterium]|jgi:alpha-amylase